MILIIIVFLVSYLLGAIPTGYIITVWFKGLDVREFGSGNVGATNVTRILGLRYGIAVAALDILKGFIAVTLAQFLLPEVNIAVIFIAGFLAIIGHDWSVFLKFSGGKGVATTAGVILKIMPASFIYFAVIWLLLVIITRYVSLGSITGTISIPLTAYYYYNFEFVVFALIITLFVLLTHHENIKRLIRGEENRMGWPPTIEGEG